MAIIVVEGIDRVGKTTFISKLQSKLGTGHSFVFKHNCSIVDYADMDDDNEADKMVQLLEMCSQIYAVSKDDFVLLFDRFHASNAVYGIIERNYDFKNACENFEIIDDLLRKFNTYIVYVKPTNIERSSTEHGKSLKLHDKLFDLFIALSSCNKVVCDYYSLDEAIDYVTYDSDGDFYVR